MSYYMALIMMMSEKKGSLPTIWTENESIQTKNCVAALSMMTSIVFGSLVRQVWPLLPYQVIWQFLQALTDGGT